MIVCVHSKAVIDIHLFHAKSVFMSKQCETQMSFVVVVSSLDRLSHPQDQSTILTLQSSGWAV